MSDVHATAEAQGQNTSTSSDSADVSGLEDNMLSAVAAKRVSVSRDTWLHFHSSHEHDTMLKDLQLVTK